ncbi:MAG: hypothetical protein WBD15_13195, partial [Pseudolabrys sp.]
SKKRALAVAAILPLTVGRSKVRSVPATHVQVFGHTEPSNKNRSLYLDIDYSSRRKADREYASNQMRQEVLLIVFLWFAIQIPLGRFVGDCIRFGMKPPKVTRNRALRFRN